MTKAHLECSNNKTPKHSDILGFFTITIKKWSNSTTHTLIYIWIYIFVSELIEDAR